ncbi:hypothetical protein [Virgibacillus sp. MG-45]|uniref:hypothetical protein n=1 Tax=Virgibacillus sp. MG-45 TaxID=3102791 RepID=UPI002ED7B704
MTSNENGSIRTEQEFKRGGCACEASLHITNQKSSKIIPKSFAYHTRDKQNNIKVNSRFKHFN